MVVLTWLYPRAAFWLLDRDGIKGHFGEKPAQAGRRRRGRRGRGRAGAAQGHRRVGRARPAHLLPRPARPRRRTRAYVEEVARIAAECKAPRRRRPRSRRWCNSVVWRRWRSSRPRRSRRSNCWQQPGRRWYPVIDYSRCTNCMECLDFCLFGVYGVDQLDRILRREPGQLQEGLPGVQPRLSRTAPSCSPITRRPAIAGAPVGAISGLKIDLTKLFGGEDAMAHRGQGARPRTGQRRPRRGRPDVGIPKRQAGKPQGPKDDLDKLMDALDALEI